MSNFTLRKIEQSGDIVGYAGDLSDVARAVIDLTLELYAASGYEEPWVSYMGVLDNEFVGSCSFKSPPREGQVEIAYFTFPGNEGRGWATRMAGGLVAIARASREQPLVTAQTLPARNASHRVLEKLGFRAAGIVHHPDDGDVLEWRLPQERMDRG